MQGDQNVHDVLIHILVDHIKPKQKCRGNNWEFQCFFLSYVLCIFIFLGEANFTILEFMDFAGHDGAQVDTGATVDDELSGYREEMKPSSDVG